MGREMVSKTLEFIFDFASPNAYLVSAILPDLAARHGAQLIITPCLLGGIFHATGNKAPFVQYADIPSKIAYEQLEMRRFIARHGIDKFRMNPFFPINSLTLMRAAIAADHAGQLQAFITIVNRAMWEDGANVGDAAELQSLLDAHGLDGAALLASAQDSAVKAKLLANTQHAVERGAFGIPSFFVGDELFFGKERLAQVEEALAGA